jgi:hypothetical protein
MQKTSYLSMIAIAMFIHVAALAQGDSVKSKAQFKLGVFYNSNLNYYGRTDSLHSSGVFPIAEFWFNNNLYVNAAPVFVNNVSQRFQYAGTVLTAGYRFDGSKMSGNFYFTKPLYESSAKLVQSALKAQVAGLLTLKNKILNINAGGDVKFSNNTDYGITAGLDHIIRFSLPGNFILVMDPSAYLYAGTQQFTNTYYKKNNFLFLPGVEEQVTESVKKFNMLSYEFSMPIVLAKGKFQFILIPAYVMPQNLIAERGKDMLYVTAGAKINF